MSGFNARFRQEARVASLIDGHISFAGVRNDLEAAGCLVDGLDAIGGKEGLILVNVAPRHGEAKKWANGSPFVHFYYQNIAVLASSGGFTLSLAKKLGCLGPIFQLNILKFIPKMARDSQFRSFDFLPYLSRDIIDDKVVSVVSDFIPDTEIPDPGKTIWYIDCFGNAKTTLLKEDVNFKGWYLG